MEKISSLVLRLTERCSLCCAYCYAHRDGAVIPDMSEEMALEAVAQCCPAGESLRIQFTGGEPLLRLEVMEAVCAFGRATGRRLHLAVQTNGVLLSPDMCRRLAAMGCAVGVSLDGLAPANALRTFPDGEPSFAAAVQGIRNLGAAGLRCNLTTVVTRTSAPHLGQLPDLALWLGNVSGVGLDLFRPLGRGQGQPLAPAEEVLESGLRAMIRRTRELREAGISFRLRELERHRRRQACGGCGGIYCYAQTDRSLAIDGAGDCWPCSSLAGAPGCLLGNLRNGLPQRPRAALGLDAPEACAACEAFPLCGGGCPAGRTAAGEGPDRLTCVMSRVLAEASKEETTT